MLSIVIGVAVFGSAFAEFPPDCPNVTVMHGVVKDSWYDACLGLNFHADSGTVEACKAQCYSDMNCSVWQLVDSSGTKKCWSGSVVHGCLSRGSDTKLEKFEGDLIDGERIQHGEAAVVTKNANVETLGLKHYPESTGTQEEQLKRCKEFCMTDVTCTVWQYGSNGCWIEHGPNNFKTTTDTESEWAKGMIDGETIEHTCPPYVQPDEFPWLWVILGCVLALIGLAALIYLLNKKPKTKKTRAMKITQKPEPPPATPIYFIPQPTVLIPQQSVIMQQPLVTTTMTAAPTYTTTTPAYAPLATAQPTYSVLT